jgi:hypothetical protein
LAVICPGGRPEVVVGACAREYQGLRARWWRDLALGGECSRWGLIIRMPKNFLASEWGLENSERGQIGLGGVSA